MIAAPGIVGTLGLRAEPSDVISTIESEGRSALSR